MTHYAKTGRGEFSPHESVVKTERTLIVHGSEALGNSPKVQILQNRRKKIDREGQK